MKGLINLQSLHKYSSKHKEQIQKSEFCGCFCCNAIFHPTTIFEWADEGTTAVCPFCSIDSVLPDTLNIDLTQELLQEMGDYWFEHEESSNMGRILVRNITEGQNQEQG